MGGRAGARPSRNMGTVPACRNMGTDPAWFLPQHGDRPDGVPPCGASDLEGGCQLAERNSVN